MIAPPGTTVNGVNVAGTIRAGTEMQPQFAALYPGCVPINAFDPARASRQGRLHYVSQDTFWTLTQKLDNIGGSI